MFIQFEDRPSDSPYVERIFRSRSERAGTFTSIATSQWMMAITKIQGKISLTIRGPETQATPADCPAEGEWLGILFQLGTYMPGFPANFLIDRNDVTLPEASGRSFWLDSAAWEYPDFENVETFVERLVHDELVKRDALVAAALQGKLAESSLRSAQRHFQKITGMTHDTIRQIERVRRATNLLKEGIPILEVVHEAGFFDQAHLTRSLKRYTGQTPTQIIREVEQLSFLYKTDEL